ncbi:MAG: hypothetical protein M1820_008217 [Bogoriella megaspora]|nr:MAG: hypothetical protein M1820_008217 [Bogoriella megaspora]
MKCFTFLAAISSIRCQAIADPTTRRDVSSNLVSQALATSVGSNSNVSVGVSTVTVTSLISSSPMRTATLTETVTSSSEPIPTVSPLVLDPKRAEYARSNLSTFIGWSFVAFLPVLTDSTGHPIEPSELSLLCNCLSSNEILLDEGLDLYAIREPICSIAEVGGASESFVAAQIRDSASNLYLTYLLNAGNDSSTTFLQAACSALSYSYLESIDLSGSLVLDTICGKAGMTAVHDNITFDGNFEAIQVTASNLLAWIFMSTWMNTSVASVSCNSVSGDEPETGWAIDSIESTQLLLPWILADTWCQYTNSMPSDKDIVDTTKTFPTTLFENQLKNSVTNATEEWYWEYLVKNVNEGSLDVMGINGTVILVAVKNFIDRT